MASCENQFEPTEEVAKFPTVCLGTIPKFRTVPKFLQNRELGVVKANNSEYLRLKMYYKTEMQNICLNTVQVPHKIVGVDFIKGEKQSILCMWRKEAPYNKFVVGEQRYYSNGEYRYVPHKKAFFQAIDMCLGPQATIVCLHRHDRFDIGCIEYISKDFVPNQRETGISNGNGNIPYYSCCTIRPNSTFGVGSLNKVLLFNDFEAYDTYPIDGEVKLLAFEESSNKLIAGLHTGFLFLIDPRTDNPQAEIAISKSILLDSVFINQHRAIIADVNSSLVEVDFRKMEVVTIFNGHSHSEVHCPLSYGNNKLCATGADNVIRIWNASGGYPLHEMSPRWNPANRIRGCLEIHADHYVMHLLHGI